MKQLRVGVVGMGFAGWLHASSYNMLGDKAKLVAVCDSDEEKVANLAEQLGTLAITDYAALLARADIDAIDVCVPHHLHRRFAVEAARAGKHILLEKPIATSIEDADAIISAAAEAGVTLMVAENHLFLPANRKVKEIIDSGEIGRVFLVRAYEGAISELTVNPNPEDWRTLPNNEGVLLDMAVHKFAMLRWMLGDIASVFAVKEKLVVTDLAPNYDDTALVTVKFASGAVGEIVVTSGVAGGETNSLEVYGTDGTILENHMWPRPVMYMSRKTSKSTWIWVYPVKWRRPKLEHGPFPQYYEISFREEVEHFVDCVLQGKIPDMTGEDARESIRVAIAASESAARKQFVDVRA
ncbi:MAG: Gfo/Idh/MocA family oxidoreductase [Actinomycetota bacterium]